MKHVSLIFSLLIASMSGAWAATINFSYTATGPNGAGSGTLDAVVNGVTLGAAMPTPTFNQKDTTTESLPAGIVGFVTTTSSANPGANSGFHLGWSGTVTLTGQIDDALDPNTGTSNAGQINLYEFVVTLQYEDPASSNARYYQVDLFDDNSGVGGTNDVSGTLQFGGWIGDDGGGHRHTQSGSVTFGAGADVLNSVATTSSAGIGGGGNGDNVGITFGGRTGTFNGIVFVSRLTFSGTLQDPDGNLTFVGSIPEPSTALLGLMGALLLLRRRRG